MARIDDVYPQILRSLGDHAGIRLDRAHLDEPLASLGLDSLGTLRWSKQVFQDHGIDVPLGHLVGSATVAQMLEQVALAQQDSKPDYPPAPPESPDLTVVQQAYWAGRGGDFPGGGVATFWFHEYERGAEHRSGRSLADDLTRLETAWKRIVAHHPMLRTIVDRDAQPRIAVHDVRDWRLPRHDLRYLAEAEAAAKADDLRDELSHQVRPTDQWPIIDITAIVLPTDHVRLCIGFDALLVDFASWGIIMRDWGAVVRRSQTRLEPQTLTFGDALAQRAADPARQERRAGDRAWWQEQQIPPAPLPQAAFPVTTRFRRHRQVVPADTWSQIVYHARARGVSTSSVVLTAFALACDRWGQCQPAGMTLNLTVFDRPDDCEDIVGDFSATALLALTAGWHPESTASFGELATAVNRRFWDVLDRRAYGGVEVGRDRPEAGPWPIVFTSGLGQPSGEADRWLGERTFGVSQTPQVLWDHLVWEEDEALVLTHDVVEGAADEIIEGLTAMERTLVVSLATADGWDRPAPGWDPRAEVVPPARMRTDVGPLLHDPWVRASTEHAETPALVTAEGSITHAELRHRAEVVANAVAAQGVGAGDVVLVALPKGVDQIAAVMGIMLTGAGYVPADPAWPLTRLETICRRTGLNVAVMADGVELPEGVERVEVGGHDEVGADDGDPFPEADRPEPSELSYVIFTSGSTGEPKGVAIEHRQARTTIDEINARFSITSSDRVLAVSALSFDLSVYDVFGVLGVGGAIVLPDPQRLRDPQHWLDLMAQEEVTVWNSAPPMMEMLLEYADSVPDQAGAALGRLRHCLLSGDWIPVTLPDRLRAFAPDVEIHSLGGATEASIWSITYPVGDLDPTWASIPYGRALPGQSFWILNDDGTPAHVGQPGELYIGGEGVARGYIGREDLTTERFLPRDDLGTRHYRTGDLGRWRNDGTIEFLGRVDRQVKVGGHRIELGEVEAALLRLPQVRQAVASSVPGPDQRPRLVAHVSASGKDWAALSAAEQRRVSAHLAEALGEHVPAYMIPGTFVLMTELPTTENGKVDYKGLPNPYDRRSTPTNPPESHDCTIAPEEAAPTPTTAPEEAVPIPRPVQSAPVATSPLHENLVAILGPEMSLTNSLAQNGASSLQLVRIANLVEDLSGARPAMTTMLGPTSTVDLLSQWEQQASKPLAVERAEPSSDASNALEMPEPHPLVEDARPAVPSSVEAEPSSAPSHTPAGLANAPTTTLVSMADRLRRVADSLEAADVELTAVTQMLRAGDSESPRTSASSPPSAGDQPTNRQPPGEEPTKDQPGAAFDLTEMQLAYLVGRAPDEFGRELAPHYYTEALVDDLRPETLQEAWDGVVRRHPMLRDAITPETRQHVASAVSAHVECVDQRALSPAEQQAFRERTRAARSHRLLPTGKGPMVRLLAARLDDRTWRVHLDLDLLFCDAASAVTLVEELAAGYADPHRVLDTPPGAFQEWVRAEQPGDTAQKYWSQAVAQLPDPVVPPLQQRGSEAAHFVRRRHELDAASWSAIRRQAAAHGVTVSCLLLDALGSILTPHTTGAVMLTLSRRPVDQSGTIGDYTATVPVVVGGADSLAARQAALGAALDHSLAPGGMHGNAILRMLRAAGRPAVVPVAVSCALEPSSTDASQLLDALGRTEYAISQTPQVLVDVQLFDVDGRLCCNIDADESLVSPRWLDQVHAELIQALARLAGTSAPSTAKTEDVRADVRAVFRDLLGGVDLDDHQSWFDQGATSVTLVSAQRLLRERGYEIDVIDLFANPTPAGTVTHLCGQAERATRVPLIPSDDARRVPETRSSALAAAQHRGRRRRAAR